MTEQFVNSEGARLWTIAQGSGVTVVLCNGGPGCCDYLESVAVMLDDLAQVIRFEASGCGRSDPLPAYTVETCLADLEAVRQHYGIERWIVGGHSAGADLALAYALAYPEHVLGFICIAGGRIHNDREWHRIYSERRDQGLETLPAFDYPPNLEVNAQVNRSWKEYIQRPSLLNEIARLERPALFLYKELSLYFRGVFWIAQIIGWIRTRRGHARNVLIMCRPARSPEEHAAHHPDPGDSARHG
jgi:proline iminopeptidase